MTKNEILEYFKDINHAYNDCTRYDTLKRMIDELQEPCDDCVSRQAVLDLPKNTERGFGGKILEQSINIEYIKALPPVTPQYTDAEIQKMQDLEFAEIQKAYEIGKAENPNKWIPVSERLPNFAGAYLVTRYFPNNVMNPTYLVDACFFDGTDTWHNDNRINHERKYLTNVVAWLEEPEPYKASPTGAESEVQDAGCD